MSSSVAATRKRVLSLYRSIFRLARSWEAKDPTLTERERKDIITEARAKFRDNKTVTDPDEIEKLIQKAEARIVSANHYGIPYERPEYASTSQRRPSRSESERDTDATGFGLEGKSEIFCKFVRRFFASCKVDDILLDFLGDEDAQNIEEISRIVFDNPLFKRYPQKAAYAMNVIKRVIEIQEMNGFEVADRLYERISSLMAIPLEFNHRLFLDSSGSCISTVIRESNQQLIYGTTGLSLWQAACDLSHLLTFLSFDDKKVLELGAGCGLAGFALANDNPTSQLILSDFDRRVLEQLEENRKLNKKGASRVSIEFLDWTNFSMNDLPWIPDVVIASDVVYDRTLLPSLCDVISKCLNAKEGSYAIVASTLRDSDTLSAFKKAIEFAKLTIEEDFSYEHGRFNFLDGSNFPSETLFPHSSSINAPTIFYKIKTVKMSTSSNFDVGRQEVESVFAVMSSEDKPMVLKIADLKLTLRALGFDPRNSQVNELQKKLKDAKKKSEEKDDGFMTVTDLLIALKGDSTEEADKVTGEMRSAFSLFDKEKKGYITLENLKQVAAELQLEISDDELTQMMEEAAGQTEKCTEADFFEIMKKTCLY
ncbi:hypothetical protein WR25_24031 [Diploscapter pachys]|uniref:EF-hand domain-containing protein n=1 Tax=Diploscapter pachys TaxID=2018661 RepID=A0A2A2JUY8_9BILA|nr:hypothetical protein WR25_24031 [Diploscapter pachys]